MATLGPFELDTVHCVDALEALPQLPDGCVDAVITDPPYKMTKRGKSCRPNWMADNMGDNVFNGELPKTSDWLKELHRVMKDGHLYVFTNTVSIQELLNSAIAEGFDLHNIITMIKDTGMPSRWYYKQCELVLFLRKGKAKPINDYTSRDNMKVVMPKNSNGKVHITQKPLSIISKFASNSTQENEVALDCFMGSGTTGVAAVQLGRRFLGFEINQEYCDLANKRIEAARCGLTVKELDAGQGTLFNG